MLTTNLGKVRITPKGAYSAETEYSYLDVVTDSGNAYVYVNVTSSTGSPLSSATHWEKIVEKGEQGIQGTSISSIARTSGDGSPGTTDTYTIYYDNNTTDTFEVFNGATGDSGVHIGTDAPVDPNKLVWFDTDGTPTKLYFKDKYVETTDWVADLTYAEFPFKADIPCVGVTSTMYASLAFAYAQATSGDYAPVCDTGADIVTIYAAEVPAADITIPVIEVLAI